jgi:hypothetical protein
MDKVIDVINITAVNDTFGVTEKQVLADGKIIGMSIYHGNLNNVGIVQARLECNGTEIIPMHHIDDFRNRETSFDKGYIPLDLDGGKTYSVQIYSEDKFTADTKLQAVFYYEKKFNC